MIPQTHSGNITGCLLYFLFHPFPNFGSCLTDLSVLLVVRQPECALVSLLLTTTINLETIRAFLTNILQGVWGSETGLCGEKRGRV